jgi:hypothetical protein
VPRLSPQHPQTTEAPEISVVIPFDDPRGDPRFINSWTHEQTCAPERFEVIVITSGAAPGLDAQLRAHLRPDDKLIHASASSRFGYYDPGARIARGRLLLLTEDHCVADRRCLETTLDSFAAHPDLCGGFLEAGHINTTHFAHAEQRLYDKMFAEHWSRPEYWDKVRIRGTALARDAYWAAGGIIDRYDHFAETLLSARLHTGGHRMGYVPGAIVSHVNTTSFSMMEYEVGRFAAGEFCYRAESVEPHLEPFLGLPTAWSQHHLRSPRLAKRAARALSLVMHESRRRGDRRAARALAACRRDALLDTHCGRRWRMVVARGAIALARVRYAWRRGDESRRADAVAEFWRAANELGRLRASALLAQPPRGIPVDPDHELPIGGTSSRDLIGFHAAEVHQGISFRWSSPVAVVPVELAAGDFEISIDTASLRGPQCDFPVLLMWNDAVIPATSLRVSEGCIRGMVTADMFVQDEPQHLLIASAPPPRTRGGPVDPRPLGMPIRAITFTPVSTGRRHRPHEVLTRPAARHAVRTDVHCS